MADSPTGEAGGVPTRLNIWDFGGQDIYHGTHALFMRSRAIFLLAWTPAFENDKEVCYGGFVFRNQRLTYWLNYIRQFGGEDSPVIVVQARCDCWNDERQPPIPEKALGQFRIRPRIVHHSAREKRGRDALREALQEAADYLREQHGTAVIGTGRATVKRRLETMRDADAKRPREERQHRTISKDEFFQFCDEAGQISDRARLLTYLTNVGTVFYQPGLFDDRIILDQDWALEAIYAVFHREKCFKKIERRHGRFTRSDLADWIWDEAGYRLKEQKLFLSMMLSCGICFEHRAAVQDKNIETEYIAPDLLPDKSETDVEQKWDPDKPTETAAFEFELLPAGLIRGIISRIGSAAGLAGTYWRGGVFVYEAGTKSKALIEQKPAEDWGGTIRVTTEGGQAALLLDRLVELVEEEHQRLGMTAERVTRSSPGFAKEREPTKPSADGATDASPPLTFAPPPADKPEYFVSYAWKDDTPEGRNREETVDRLCAEAEARGRKIIRDKNELRVGDRISQFMQRMIFAGNQVFVVLSDRYLRSTYCMNELAGIWRNCRHDDKEFLRRVRPFTLKDALIRTPLDRASYAEYWENKYKELEAKLRHLSESDFREYRLMKEFAHVVPEILSLFADTLQPRSFDELVKYGFDDPPS